MAQARRCRVRNFVLAAVLAVLAPSASADIRAFNTALKAGDYRAASAAAAETWPGLDKAAPDIAVTAREFAWVSMLAGDPGKAQAYSSFLVARAATLGPGDPAAVTWRVLDAWVAFALRPASDTRKALADALAARTAVAGKDLISLRAAQALFKDEWDAGLWRDATAVAQSGARIARDFGRGFVDVVYRLETGRLAASFVDRATNEAAMYLDDLALRVYAEAMTETDAGMKQRLVDVFFAADAWAEAANLRLVQQGRKRASADKPKSTIPARLTPAPGDPALPECQIGRAANAREPEFSANRRFQGWPGFATYRLKVAEGGRFSEVRVMAIAPFGELGVTTFKGLEDWRWQFMGAARPPACRIPAYYYLAFEFQVPS
jgi:hypothetical protein